MPLSSRSKHSKALMLRLWRNIENKDTAIDAKVRKSQHATVNIPQPQRRKGVIVRMNAFPVNSLPGECRAVASSKQWGCEVSTPEATPEDTSWMRTLAQGQDDDRTATHGYEATREAAMGGVRQELAARKTFALAISSVPKSQIEPTPVPVGGSMEFWHSARLKSSSLHSSQ
jgi:hypothetical protein